MHRTFFKQPKIRDRSHLNFVKTLPCVYCLKGPCDPAHTPDKETSAMGDKAPDNCVVSLCRECHSLQHNMGHLRFWAAMNKTIEDVQVLANVFWVRTGDKDACIEQIVRFRKRK